MCARIDQDEPAIKKLRRLGMVNLPARREVFPRMQVGLVRTDPATGALGTAEAYWGLVPAGTAEPKNFEKRYATYNARAETVHSKPTFAEAFKHRRCAIPVGGFYEHTDKLPPKDQFVVAVCGLEEPVLWLAGLWEQHEALGLTCTIVTTEPNELIGQVHSRMPVILARNRVQDWIDHGYRQLLAPWTATPLAMLNWAGRPTWDHVRESQRHVDSARGWGKLHNGAYPKWRDTES